MELQPACAQHRGCALGTGALGLSQSAPNTSRQQKLEKGLRHSGCGNVELLGCSLENLTEGKRVNRGPAAPALRQSWGLHLANSSSSCKDLFHPPDTLIRSSELVCSCQWLLLAFHFSLALRSARSPPLPAFPLSFLACFLLPLLLLNIFLSSQDQVQHPSPK